MSWKGPRTASSHITSTNHWRQLRQTILERDHHQCQIRTPGICTGHATVVDKIHTAAAGGNWQNPTNLRAACWHCNDHRGRQDSHTSRRTNLTATRHPDTRNSHPGLR